MKYYIGQAFGLLCTLCCLILPLPKKKLNMLIINAVNNASVVINILLLTGFSSAIMVCAVAVVQSLVAIIHLKKDTSISRGENLLFLVLYVGCGFLGFHTLLDALPIVGAVFNMLATFQRDEQRTRWLLLFNAATFAIYYAIIGSTALLAVLCTIASSILGLVRNRKQ